MTLMLTLFGRATPPLHPPRARARPQCNYGGLLIVWDRMFGTYACETVKKDLYGLADPPQTFDPLALNAQHLKRLRNLRGGGIWSNPCARRVRAKWVCDPRLLCEQIPPSGADERAVASRKKWDGAGGALTAFGAAGLLVLGVSATASAFTLLVKAPSMQKADRAVGITVALALFRCVCLVCDFREGQWKSALVGAAVLLPALVALIAYEPFAAGLLSGRTYSPNEL